MTTFADPNKYGRHLSLRDVAEILGVHLNTAQRYARHGVIPAHRLPGGRRYYVLKDELLEYIRTRPPDTGRGRRRGVLPSWRPPN